MKATAVAPSNIAFIKYWGKKDKNLRLPANTSISMNLSNAFTTTTVEFSADNKKDEIYFGEKRMDRKSSIRVISHLDRIRRIAKKNLFAKVVTQNSFPQSTGIASSASGFAALTLAAVGAMDLKCSEKDLSILARLGSGSACRSIPCGFVEWKVSKTSENSYSFSLYDEKHWDLKDIIAVVSTEEKKTSSTLGHENAKSSPLFSKRLEHLPARIVKLKEALKEKNIKKLGELIEKEAIELHMIMMTQDPPLFYWDGSTMEIVKLVRLWRNDGLLVYFTLDAGPNVHLICESKEENKVLEKLKKLSYIKNVIINSPSSGARLIDKHLF
ncbi:diphosphomevalonate decarboxylase [Candidatus Gottesmanbacteria bacterium]|nr:diphosphomevalonate decarboxylase [Candidatus Gottesmanbacteria bacterium]